MHSRSLVQVDTRSITKLIAYYQTWDDSYIASFDLETLLKKIT